MKHWRSLVVARRRARGCRRPGDLALGADGVDDEPRRAAGSTRREGSRSPRTARSTSPREVTAEMPATRRGRPCSASARRQGSRASTSTTGVVTPVVTGLYSRAVPNEGITGVDGRRRGAAGSSSRRSPRSRRSFASFDCTGRPADCAASLARCAGAGGPAALVHPGRHVEGRRGCRRQTTTRGRTTDTSLTRSPPNANPYGRRTASRAGAYIADAGANVLDFVIGERRHDDHLGDPAASSRRLPGRRRPDVRDDGAREPLRRRSRGPPVEAEWQLHADAGGRSRTAAARALSTMSRAAPSTSNGNIYLVDMWGQPGPPIPAGPASVANTGSVVELQKDGSAVVARQRARFPERHRDRERRVALRDDEQHLHRDRHAAAVLRPGRPARTARPGLTGLAGRVPGSPRDTARLSVRCESFSGRKAGETGPEYLRALARSSLFAVGVRQSRRCYHVLPPARGRGCKRARTRPASTA